jgi:hypothetical protein
MMTRHLTTRAAALGIAVVSGVTLLAQTRPVTMNEASHHQRLTYLRHMRVFEVNVPPGESTVDHLNDHDVAVIPLVSGTTRSRRVGEDWHAPQSRSAGQAAMTLYTGAATTHRTENVGSTPYRAFIVENLRDKGWTTPAPLTAPGTSLRQEARSHAAYDVRLSTATPRTVHVHENPSFVFLMSGAVQVQGGGGEAEFRLEQLGRWFPSSGPDQPHTLTLVGTGDAHVVCVEAR